MVVLVGCSTDFTVLIALSANIRFGSSSSCGSNGNCHSTGLEQYLLLLLLLLFTWGRRPSTPRTPGYALKKLL